MASKQLYTPGMSAFRTIVQLIRQKKGSASSVASMKHFVSLIRQNEVTDQRHCRAPEELQFIAESYRTYLSSGIRHNELFNKYHSQRERSVEETASLVGFKLPERQSPFAAK